MVATSLGPLFGPIMGGFIAVVSWRWIFWLSLILAGATWPILLLSPETYGPSILQARAKRLRKSTNNPNIFSPIELQETSLKQLVTVVLARPLHMFFTEAIVLCSCLYLAFAYGIFYIFLQAFPLIYTRIYGFNAGEVGLTFLAIGLGSLLAYVIYALWDRYLENAKNRSPPAPWSQREEYRRLPLACIAGPLLVVSLFWAGWSAREDVHWIVPTLAGVPFGISFALLFIALLNYLVDAYEVFAASASAASACSRSLFGAVLPFAAKPMYEKLGVAWACSLLGFLSLAMCVIPFVFIRYGDAIRAKSKFCQQLKLRKEEEEMDMERQREIVRRDEGIALEAHGSEKMV